MKSLRLSLLGLPVITATMLLSVMANAVSRGGGGPTPLIDIPVTPLPQQIQTEDGVQDFILWEKSSQLLYRDDDDDLNVIDLGSGSSYQYSTMEEPISRVVDPKEQFILARGIGRFFDAFSRLWRWIIKKKQMPMHHLFWQGDELYSIGQDPTKSGAEFQIYQYKKGDDLATPKCDPFSLTTGATTDLQLRIAQGTSFPDVYIYKTQKVDINGVAIFSLWLRHYNVDKCELSDWSVYLDELPGVVKSMFWFNQLNAIALSIDDPERNLLWKSPDGIKYFDLGTTELPMLPNPQLPVLATFDTSTGLRLVFPDQEKRFLLGNTVNITELNQENIWLTQDSKHLYVAPHVGFQTPRALVRLDLPPLCSGEARGKNLTCD